MDVVAALVAVCALVGFAGTSALETAILSLSFSEEKKLLKALKVRLPKISLLFSGALTAWHKHPTAILMTILILNTFFSMVWCVFSMRLAGSWFFIPLLVGLALFLVGELFPKVLARRFPAKTLLFLLLPFYGIFRVMYFWVGPVARFLEQGMRRLSAEAFSFPFQEGELKLLIRDLELTEGIRPKSRLVLEGLLEFSSKKVRDLMRTGENVFCLNLAEGDLSNLARKIVDKPYSRIPVTKDGRLENTIGVLYVKDLLFTFPTSGLVNLQDILRPCPIVEANLSVGNFLNLARREAVHIAAVRSKVGKIEGVLFLEDVLKSIVGDIRDEFA